MISPEVLRRYPYFASVDDDSLKAVAVIADEKTIPAGTHLFSEADPADTLRAVSESAMRDIIARSELAPVLNRDRGAIATDLQAAVAYLNAQGVPTETPRIDQSTGRWFTFFADPDGLPLELYENTEKRERPFSGDNPGFPISSSVSRESSLEPTPCPASPLPL